MLHSRSYLAWGAVVATLLSAIASTLLLLSAGLGLATWPGYDKGSSGTALRLPDPPPVTAPASARRSTADRDRSSRPAGPAAAAVGPTGPALSVPATTPTPSSSTSAPSRSPAPVSRPRSARRSAAPQRTTVVTSMPDEPGSTASVVTSAPSVSAPAPAARKPAAKAAPKPAAKPAPKRAATSASTNSGSSKQQVHVIVSDGEGG